MNGLQVLLAVLTVAVSCFLHARAAAAVAKQPNVVIFMADDLGIGDVGCFGNDTIRTPSIDWIAGQGVKLTQHLAAAAVCTPSRAAFLTGRYPIRSGLAASNFMRAIPFLTGSAGLPASETTFATVAKKHGYSTALIGKWHLGVYCEGRYDDYFCHHPLQHGFDYFYGLPLTNARDFGPKSWNSVTRHFSHFYEILFAVALGSLVVAKILQSFAIIPMRYVLTFLLIMCVPTFIVKFVFGNISLLNSVVMRNYEYVEQPIHFENFTQRLVAEGVEFLEHRHADARPFLLMMSWIQVHTVLHTSAEFRGRSSHGPYGDNVEEMDWSVGEVLRCLERLELLDNTLVYFTSDNGGYLEARGQLGIQEGGWNGIYRGGKSHEVMEGGIRVPTVVMWRGQFPPETVLDIPTSQMDIFATLEASVWNDPPATDRVIDGRNLYPLLTGEDDHTPPHRFLMHYCGHRIHAARFVPGNGDNVYKIYYATPNWIRGTQECEKTCYCTDDSVTWHDPPLLYNVARDPSELRPLMVSDHPSVMDEVRRAVSEHLSTVDHAVDHQLTAWKLFPRLWRQPCCNYPSCNCLDPTYAHVVHQLQQEEAEKQNTD